MRRILLIAAVALTACSDKPVGQSEYFDPWDSPQLQGDGPQKSSDVIALNRQLEQRQVQNRTQVAAQNSDAALVSSLEAAIATAGNDQRASGQTVQQLPSSPQVAGVPASQPVAVPIQSDGQISDNSFSTVVQKESIETDAAKLAALSKSNVVLEAAPLPEREEGVNPAAFARTTSHNIGERIYPRSSRSSASQRCRKYGNPDAAQRAFLAAGGPVSDDLRLDPDGDGFVCGWSPIPFRNLRVGG